jgi:hypothetical protein
MRQTAFKQTATRLTPVRRCAILLRLIAASLPLPLLILLVIGKDFLEIPKVGDGNLFVRKGFSDK